MDALPPGSVAIDGRPIGPPFPCFVVAEVSANHEGDLRNALALVDAAATAGADAVKFQLYRPEDLTADVPSWRIRGGPWDGSTLWELYTRAQTPVEWMPELFAAVRARGMIPFASVFAPWAVEALEKLDAPCYKIASLELGERTLIACVAATGKPLILSTGRATTATLEAALESCGPTPRILLHCVAAYPAPLHALHLRTLTHLRAFYGDPVGLSDHACQPVALTAAVALGARVWEAHLMLPRPNQALDAAHSLEPGDFKEMVGILRDTEAALGASRFAGAAITAEQATEGFVRRWVYASALYAGHVLVAADVVRLRAPEGWPTDEPLPLGRTLGRDVAAYDGIQLRDFR